MAKLFTTPSEAVAMATDEFERLYWLLVTDSDQVDRTDSRKFSREFVKENVSHLQNTDTDGVPRVYGLYTDQLYNHETQLWEQRSNDPEEAFANLEKYGAKREDSAHTNCTFIFDDVLWGDNLDSFCTVLRLIEPFGLGGLTRVEIRKMAGELQDALAHFLELKKGKPVTPANAPTKLLDTLTKQESKLFLALWPPNRSVTLWALRESVWAGKLISDEGIKKAARRLNNKLMEPVRRKLARLSLDVKPATLRLFWDR